MTQKAIIELRTGPVKQQGDYQVRGKLRPELKISAHKKAQELIARRMITTRDINMARALIGVGILTRHQLQRLFFGDHAKVASNRLVKLYRYYFLDRGHYWLEEMAAMGLAPSYLYTLGSVGQEIFALYNGIRRHEVPLAADRYSLMRSNHFLLHDLQISEMFTRLQLATAAAGKRLIWYNETAAAVRDGERELVRPDGLAMVYDDAWQMNAFVEMDRGHTAWAQKIAYYERARQHHTWRRQLQVDRYPWVLCVVPAGTVPKLDALLRQQQPQTRFLLKTWPALLQSGVQTDWLDVLQAQPVALWPAES